MNLVAENYLKGELQDLMETDIRTMFMVFDTRYLAKRYAEERLAISEYKIVKTQEGYVLYVPLNFIDVSRETSKNRRKYND